MKDFSKIKLTLSSPDDIRDRSFGEITKPETINYRTLVPEHGGLFCEAIFGPVKDHTCSCGKYKRIRYKGIICEKCGVEVTKSSVRRERMGHIELAVPIAHIWFSKGIPNYMGMILGVSPKDLESVIYFNKHIVIDPGNSRFTTYQILDEREINTFMGEAPTSTLKVGIGAEAVLECLENLDLHVLKSSLIEKLEISDSVQMKKKIMKRLDLVKSFITSGNKPDWMILRALPVMPADLRPMVQLDGGRFATSDLNDLYRRVINRNKRLKKLQSMYAPDIILRNEKRMLQEAVDALLDNSKRDNPSLANGTRDLKSLSDMLKGKQGRFRQNLLGKRVDYSGRSVIVVGPNLKLNQCGLPKKMALELYKPFIMRALVAKELAINIKSAKRMIETEHDSVWSVAEEVIRDHPLLLNRPPTLHKFSIQAFEPVLIEGKAIRLHPLVCAGFNADFDGDQLSVHLPLSPHSIMEAKILMLSVNNLISPSNGRPIISPSREMLMGCYYATVIRENAKGTGRMFSNLSEAIVAYESGIIAVNALIKVKMDHQNVDTTVGRLMFNEILPTDLRDYSKSFVDKDFRKLISDMFKIHGSTKTSEIVNNIKDFGFKHGTNAGITISVDDLIVPTNREKIIAEAEKKIEDIDAAHVKGALINEERYREAIDVWNDAVNEIVSSLLSETDAFNPVLMMSKSGARGGVTQMRQLSGIRGLMSDTQGRTIEVPIKSSFRHGLKVIEFFMSSYGARKGTADKALRTADSGYLTRRLVDVAHDIIISEFDCQTERSIYITDIHSDGQIVESFLDRLMSRTVAADIKVGDKVLAYKNEMITEELADWIVKQGVTSAYIRSPMTCQSRRGVCSKCYGMDLATHKQVILGEAVGVIAAQSIGEPGTQLTMRTFHTGGVSERESVFKELVAKAEGIVKFTNINAVENKNKELIVFKNSKLEVGSELYDVPLGSILKVKDGEKVSKNSVLAKLKPYALELISLTEGNFDYSDVICNEKLDSRSGIKERIVIKSKNNNDVAYVYIRKGVKGDVVAKYPVYSGTFLLFNQGDKVAVGDILAKTLKEDKKSNKDITGGLPRIQQLLELRVPQDKAIIATMDGIVHIQEEPKKGFKVIRIENGIDFTEYLLAFADTILVADGSEIKKGAKITEGTIFVGDLLEVEGVISAQSFIVESVQRIYREQGVRINDKHVEMIVKQMFRKIRITNAGDSTYFEGETISLRELNKLNEALKAEGRNSIQYVPIVQGITKASIDTDSFISAASFQETTRVLAGAAIRGSIDLLEGLKENVIIGRKIPAGTGMERYSQVEVTENER